jgi:hypothetical protein
MSISCFQKFAYFLLSRDEAVTLQRVFVFSEGLEVGFKKSQSSLGVSRVETRSP